MAHAVVPNNPGDACHACSDKEADDSCAPPGVRNSTSPLQREQQLDSGAGKLKESTKVESMREDCTELVPDGGPGLAAPLHLDGLLRNMN